METVEELADRAEGAARERRAASRRVGEAEAEVTQTAQKQHEAEETTSAAGRALLDVVREHLVAYEELTVDDPVGLLDRLQEWAGHLTGPLSGAAGGEPGPPGHRRATR
ncbi:hypothetical protein [Streptomyces sp. NBC_00268]|uniref:hypothetical protein n=1 Tax=Streptomyces sp. NBC_00268 TaxID=2975695 RepID=UPI00225792F6|nr:hypothetical protein [Streptomyces sp. NBC_00268]